VPIGWSECTSFIVLPQRIKTWCLMALAVSRAIGVQVVLLMVLKTEKLIFLNVSLNLAKTKNTYHCCGV